MNLSQAIPSFMELIKGMLQVLAPYAYIKVYLLVAVGLGEMNY